MSAAQIMTAVVGILLAAGAAGAGEAGQEKLPPKAQEAEQAVKAHLRQFKGAENGVVEWVGDEAVAKAFPRDHFFAVWFRQYPVARLVPEGLDSSNLFVVAGTKVTRLADRKALEEYFRKNLAPVKDEKSAEHALGTWLALSTAYLRDGFFQFEILSKEFRITGGDKGLVAVGRAMVTRGGNGEVRATLHFSPAGKLREVKEASSVRPGPRPICQATKLLDPDPIVRRMAEQDLLIMGLAARDYLQEQRARATPELRQAIDGLWQRIVAQGW